jgi:hypothetical protein
MKRRNMAAGLTLILVGLIAPSLIGAQTAPAPSNKIGGENRFLMRFVEDAAIVPSYWLEGQIWFESNRPSYLPVLCDDPDHCNELNTSDSETAGQADVMGLTPTFALNVAEDLEFGGRIGFLRRDANGGGTDNGISDLDLWGKISVVSDPVKISLGILLSLPTGEADKLLGTGETEVEFFGGIRKDFARFTVMGNVGARINQDQQFHGSRGNGKNSFLVGAGILFPVSDKVVLSAEWAFETERLDGLENDSRLMGGCEYRFDENFVLRAGVGGGLLTDGSPDFLATGSVAWLF